METEFSTHSLKNGSVSEFLQKWEIATIESLIASYGLVRAKESILREIVSVCKRYTCPFDVKSVAHGICAARANHQLATLRPILQGRRYNGQR